MGYSLTLEQSQLRDIFRDFFTREVSSAYLRQVITSDAPSDKLLWDKLLELDLFSLFAGEEGSGLVELGIIAQESGRCLLPEALIDNLFAGPFTARAASKVGASSEALKVLKGKTRVAVAASTSAAPLQITVKGQTCVVSGQAKFIRSALSADCVLVLTDKAVAVVELSNAAKQVTVAPENGLDFSIKQGTVTLSNAKGLILDRVESLSLLEGLQILRACEIAGACEKAVEMTAEYVKTRKQFDLPVGAFQAVQHRLADMLLQTEAISALSYFATWSADNDPKQQSLAAKAAISYACEHGPEVIEGAIQLHGGIGFTWEFDLHLYLRRVRTISALYGLDDQGYIGLLGLVNEA
jgi:alkylation response protein AidB-like acyl-CoA dehydrogenase